MQLHRNNQLHFSPSPKLSQLKYRIKLLNKYLLTNLKPKLLYLRVIPSKKKPRRLINQVIVMMIKSDRSNLMKISSRSWMTSR